MNQGLDVIFPNRRLRVCVWNPTPAMAGASLAQMEAELKKLGTVQLVPLKSLDDPTLLPCDLLVITATYIEEEAFAQWIHGVEARIARQVGIKIPTVICATISAAVQRPLLRAAVESNWYFDIVDPEHISSLPIRVANFLRLHDHLHEVQRMQAVVADLNSRVENLEESLRSSLASMGSKP